MDNIILSCHNEKSDTNYNYNCIIIFYSLLAGNLLSSYRIYTVLISVIIELFLSVLYHIYYTIRQRNQVLCKE